MIYIKKVLAERRAWELAKTHNLDLVVVNPGRVGGGQTKVKVTMCKYPYTSPYINPIDTHPPTLSLSSSIRMGSPGGARGGELQHGAAPGGVEGGAGGW